MTRYAGKGAYGAATSVSNMPAEDGEDQALVAVEGRLPVGAGR